MKQEISSSEVWPYVLPFPLDSYKRGLIWSILQSRVGLRILERIRVGRMTYQHELMELLPYSNKSVIKYLRKMVEADILEEGMKTKAERDRTVWVKWFRPTNMGRWLILFLKSPTEVSVELTKSVIAELFSLYSSSIVEVCNRYSMDIDSFHKILDRKYLQELHLHIDPIKPNAAVFGSGALDVYGFLERLPASDEVVYVEEKGCHPGGMGANVAVALARLNVPVAFFGRIGIDLLGRKLLENFRMNNVNVSNVKLVEGSSLETLILGDDEGHRWLFVVGSLHAALSLQTINEVDWNVLDSCRIVYLGEVFVELASTIADFAGTRRKMVVYRPGAPYMKAGAEKLRKILEHTTIFILNEASWRGLQEASDGRVEKPADLLDSGARNIILTKGVEGCEIFSKVGHRLIQVKPQLLKRFKSIDPTGAGDGFSAGLIEALLRGWSLERAVVQGRTVAAITCSRLGGSSAFPKSEEVDVAMSS